jgi:hypothetical protein
MADRVAQITNAVGNIQKYIAGYTSTKVGSEDYFSMVLALTSEQIKQGFAMVEAPFLNEKTNKIVYQTAKIPIQKMLNKCVQSITGCDPKIREIFQTLLDKYIEAVEKQRKPAIADLIRSKLRKYFIACLGDDRSKYDNRLMNQLDLIVQWASYIGFKDRFIQDSKDKDYEEDEEDEKEIPTI